MNERLEIDPVFTAVAVGIAIVLIIIGKSLKEKGGCLIGAGLFFALGGVGSYLSIGLAYLVPVALVFGIIYVIIDWEKFKRNF